MVGGSSLKTIDFKTKPKKKKQNHQTPCWMPLLLYTNGQVQGLGAGCSETRIQSLTLPL